MPKDNWDDQKFAKDWDIDAAVNNPMRNLLLSLLTTIVKENYKHGDKILDLGFGSGQVEQLILKGLPDAEFVGVDSSEAMMGLATGKITEDKLTAIQYDLNNISGLELPKANYGIAITSFALHEISAKAKQAVFKYIYKTLSKDGIYILVDRFKIPTDTLPAVYKSQWNWQAANRNTTNWSDWKESFEDYAGRLRTKDDSPDTVEDQLNWLREAGFNASCLQLQLDRGLIVGVKP